MTDSGPISPRSLGATPRGAVVAMRYAIEARIGKGGIGTVFLASDLHAGGRAVALKILREDRIDAEREKGLKTEYATLARLRHPHVEAVLDFGRDPQHGVYIAKEYLAGQDLMKATESMEVPDLLLLSMQLFRALAFLHSRRLIHNDIKPDNVIVLRDEAAELGRRAVLIDFGIASQYSHEATEQTPTGLVGTLGYLAPERVKGVKPDARTDLYSAGILMFRLLTRTFPFNPKSQAAELLAFHLYQQPPRPSDVRGGIPPGVDELVLRLLAKDREQRFGTAHEVLQAIGQLLGRTGPLETEATHEGYVRSVSLVGRDGELDELTTFVERATGGKRQPGEPGLALIIGEPGMGRSRLLSEILVRARLAGATVLTGSGRRRGGGLGPLRVPLRRLMSDEEAKKALDFLEAPDSDDRADRQEILRTLATLLLERGTNVVLGLEDVHLSDEMTLDLLAGVGKMLRDTPGARLACIVTTRPRGESALDAFRDALARQHLATEVALGPLTTEQVAAFVSEALPEPPPASFVKVLRARTGGDPSAIQEALKLLLAAAVLPERGVKDAKAWDLCGDAIPEGAMAILAARLAVLPAEARAALRVLALVSRPLPLSIVAAGASLEGPRATHLLQDLAKRELLLTRVVGTDLHYLLAHDRLGLAALQGATEEELRGTHDRVARAIEALPGTLAADWLQDLAHHAIRSGKAARAATHGLQAGRRLEAVYAWDQAKELYEELVEVPVLDGSTLVKTYLRLGRIHEQCGETRSAMRCLAQADRQASILGIDQDRAAALLQAAGIASRQGRRWKAEVRAIKALMLFEKHGDGPGVAQAKLLLAQFLYDDKDYKRALKTVSEARRLYEEAGDLQGLGQSLNLRGSILWKQRKLDEASHYFRQAYRIAGLVSALANWGNAQFELGDYAQANRIFRDALGLAKREGRLRDRAIVEMNLGTLRVEEGQIAKARHLFQSAIEAFDGLEEKGTLAVAMAAAARIATLQGSYGVAENLVGRALEALREQPPSFALGAVLRPMALLSLLRGDAEGATRAARRAARTDARWSEAKAQGLDALLLAEVAIEQGKREDFLREIFDARSAFGTAHSTSGLLHTDLLLARSERLWGSPREAENQLEEVARTAASRGMRLHGALACADLGPLLSDQGARERGLARLATAETYAREEGAAWLGIRVRLSRAAMLLSLGDVAGAGAELAASGQGAHDPRNVLVLHQALTVRTRVLLATGQAAEALQQAAALAQGVRGFGLPRLMVEADLLVAEAARAAGHDALAGPAVARAREAATRAGFRGYDFRGV